MILWSFAYSLTVTAVYVFCGNASQQGGEGGWLLSFCPNLDHVNIKIQSKVSICSYVTSNLRTLSQLSPLTARVIESSEICRKYLEHQVVTRSSPGEDTQGKLGKRCNAEAFTTGPCLKLFIFTTVVTRMDTPKSDSCD